MDRDGVAAQLGELALFADLSWPELERVAHTFDEEAFEPGRRVLRQGLSGSALYVILDGSATVHLDDKEEGRRLGRGEFFGEISALTGEAPNADVVAAAFLRCLVVPAPELDDFLLEHPAVLLRMLKVEVRRLRQAELTEQ